ncbi:MAG: thrombospondin type 3 repeat-containing protein [Thermoleophilaceae bacterium]
MSTMTLRFILVAALAVALAPSAEAAQTLGHTGPPQPGTADATAFQLSTASPAAFAYAIPAEGGVITSWTAQAGATGGTVKLKIVDPAAGGQYEVAAESAPVAIGPGATATTAARIPVGGGGRLGLFSQGLLPTTTDGARPADLASFAPTPDPPMRSPFTPSNAGGLLVNVSAVIEPDADTDGFGDDSQDNCAGISNRAQENTDLDAQGDACDADDDGDGLDDASELVLGTNPLRGDTDGDGRSDTADNCPTVPNPGQEDTDRSGGGDPCDPDDDQDGLTDAQEVSLRSSRTDRDSDDDGVGDFEEVRRTRTKPARVDSDRDGVPDGVELGRFRLVPGLGKVGGTNARRFQRDRDTGTRTNPRRTDTDRDGLGDGREDRNRNGRRDRGETDPRTPDTDRDGRSDRRDRDPVDPRVR